MKILDKNIEGVAELEKQLEIQQMQSLLLTACMRNDLSLATTIGVDKDGQYYMSYAVRFHGDNRDIFIGQARDAMDVYYNQVVRAVSGQVVSEVYPPAIPFLTGPSVNDSSVGKLPVAYWKSRFTINYDTTGTTIAGTTVDDTKGRTDWVGYNSQHKEIVNVPYGTENTGYENIERVQYVDLGEQGLVVAVMYKNDVLEEGQEPTLGQALQKAAHLQFVSLLGDDVPNSLPPGETDSKLSSDYGVNGTICEVTPPEVKRVEVEINGPISVVDLAEKLSTSRVVILREANLLERFIAGNDVLTVDEAKQIAKALGFLVKDPSEGNAVPKVIDIPAVITVGQLAKVLEVEPRKVTNILRDKGMFATINQALDRETATLVAVHLGWCARQPLKVVIPESIRIDDLATLLGTPVLSVLRVLEELCVPGIKTSNVSRILDDNTAEQVALTLGFEIDKPELSPVEKARLAVSAEVAKLKAQAAKKKGDLTKLVGRRRVLYAAEYMALDESLKAHYRQLLAEFGKKALNGMSEEGTLMVTAGNYCHRILDSEFLRKEWEESVPFSGPKLTLDYYIAKMVDWSDKLFFAVRGAQAPKYVKAPSKKTGVTPVEGRKATAKVAVKKPSSRKPTEKKEDGETSIE